MKASGGGRNSSNVGQRVYQWAQGIGPRDLVLIGAAFLLVGIVLSTGVIGTSGEVLALASFLFTGGIVAIVFGVPWYLLSRMYA